jgi:hypothetical protein
MKGYFHQMKFEGERTGQHPAQTPTTTTAQRTNSTSPKALPECPQRRVLRPMKPAAVGARYTGAPAVVRDGRLVTGQNPASATGVADQVLGALSSADVFA